MNVHHLELFYYVAKHGGISAAVRHIPYGIQQPAVSGQMTRLEEDAGAKLFERTPFRLTPAGEQLFAHIQPFFENLVPLAQELRAESRPELRIGGSELVLRDHVPAVMRHVRARYPHVRLTLHTGYQTQVEDWTRDGQIDIAITSASPRPPAKLRQLALVRIPLVLLVHRATPWKSAEEILGRKTIPEPLVGQPAGTSFMQTFQRDLKRRRINWPQAVEVTSAELVLRYVANGEGFGVINRAALASVKNRDVRVLPLEGFEPMLMAVLWRGEASALFREVVDAVQRYSRETFPDWVCAEEPPWRGSAGQVAEAVSTEGEALR
jgi:DNA-binding transcriptional LysR family regulator